MEGSEPEIETMNTIPGYQLESNIPQLAKQIFSKPPKLPCTICLELETENLHKRSPEQTQTVFEVLAHLLLYGIQIKYGEQQDPKRLNEKQIDTIKQYMKSIGFNIVLNTYTLDQKMNDPENYKPSDIEFYRLRMMDSEMGVWHDIKIEPYMPSHNKDTHSKHLI